MQLQTKNGSPSAKKVLIIEDNFFMAQLLLEKLARGNLNPLHAANTKEGIAAIKNGGISLVIYDAPVSNDTESYEFIENIRSIDGTVPILTLYNKPNSERVRIAMEKGCNTCLIKQESSVEDIVGEGLRLISGEPPEPVTTKPVKETGAAAPDKPVDTEVLFTDKVGSTGIEPEQIVKVKTFIETLLNTPAAEISIIDLVDNLMSYAFLVRASDIHLEPFEDSFMARLRIDGILQDVFSIPKAVQPGVISRIKVLGAMRTDEHQAAQDGRFRMSMAEQNRAFDVRVSIVPTYYGENAVLRLLAEQTRLSSLDDLAFTDEDRAKVRRAVQTPFGMILATGPTGSGKTTTLYTVLKELSTREVSIITIEDPIEYSLEGIDQIQVNTRTGLTFATGLRSVLRQDPNIIMVGEIRDEETASIAINAALTGHKLLSTLHTNDAATTLPRLLDMGVEPFLVASTVNIAIGQRLLRTICQECREARRITDGEFESLKASIPPEVLGNHREFFVGKGCPHCGNTGYRGRMGVYEILEMNDFVREAVMRHADAGEIKKIAVKNGMTTLLEDGFAKAVRGETTIEELLRVIHE